MSSLNGFGTMYYSWKHLPGGTATATKWITACWLPVVPLRRERVTVSTHLHGDEVVGAGGVLPSCARRRSA